MVAGGQADDHELGSAARLDEAAGSPPASGIRGTDRVGSGRAESAALDATQVQQMTQGLVALRQTVEQLAAGQDQIAREIKQVLAADMEFLSKMPAPPPQPPAAPARKPMLASAPPLSQAPAIAPHPVNSRLSFEV